MTSEDAFPLTPSYPGSTTKVAFANGTTRSYFTLVLFNDGYNLTGITSGTDIYEKFLVGPTGSADESTQEAPPSLVPVFSNPSLNVYDKSGSVQGFWDGDIEGNVAVLHILGFAPGENDAEVKFQEAVRDILLQSTQAGKDKLIIDLRKNGGGIVFLALDTLVQLFPDTKPDTCSNMRASAVMHAVIKTFTDGTIHDREPDPTTGLDHVEANSERFGLPFAWPVAWTPSGGSFESLDEFYGPYPSGPGEFISFFQENYTNNDRTLLDRTVFDITNADPRAQRPFDAKNMVILTDG